MLSTHQGMWAIILAHFLSTTIRMSSSQPSLEEQALRRHSCLQAASCAAEALVRVFANEPHASCRPASLSNSMLSHRPNSASGRQLPSCSHRLSGPDTLYPGVHCPHALLIGTVTHEPQEEQIGAILAPG
jgi:hypothetical protein